MWPGSAVVYARLVRQRRERTLFIRLLIIITVIFAGKITSSINIRVICNEEIIWLYIKSSIYHGMKLTGSDHIESLSYYLCISGREEAFCDLR